MTDRCEHCGRYSRAALNRISGEAARTAAGFLLGYWTARGEEYDATIGQWFTVLYAGRVVRAYETGREFKPVEQVWAAYLAGARPSEGELHS